MMIHFQLKCNFIELPTNICGNILQINKINGLVYRSNWVIPAYWYEQYKQNNRCIYTIKLSIYFTAIDPETIIIFNNTRIINFSINTVGQQKVITGFGAIIIFKK